MMALRWIKYLCLYGISWVCGLWFTVCFYSQPAEGELTFLILICCVILWIYDLQPVLFLYFVRLSLIYTRIMLLGLSEDKPYISFLLIFFQVKVMDLDGGLLLLCAVGDYNRLSMWWWHWWELNSHCGMKF